MIEKLSDKYEAIRKIGQGGMAEIWLCKDKENHQNVAIKIMISGHKNDLIKKKRFRHEIEILKKIDSPYVGKMFDAEMNDDYAYISMEYIDGYILRDYITKYSRLNVDKAVDFCTQMALGFDEIHSNKIIHRDIKSQNIMVAENGRIKIIDFGIALEDESERLTKTDMLIGSPQYIPPELIRQEKPTIQADIYSLGVLLYEMLSGNVPFNGKNALETLKKHQESNIPRITKAFPNIPQSVENIIVKATAKKTDYRYKTMYEMFRDLKICLSEKKMNEQLIELDGKPKKNFINMLNSKWTLFVLGSLFLIILAVVIVIVVVKGI